MNFMKRAGFVLTCATMLANLCAGLPAIALGVEPHSSEVMNEKPRSADESILTKDFLGKIGLEGFVIGVMTMIGCKNMSCGPSASGSRTP